MRILPFGVLACLLLTACSGRAASEAPATPGPTTDSTGVSTASPAGPETSPTPETKLAPGPTSGAGAASAKPADVTSLGLPAPAAQVTAGVMIDMKSGQVLWEVNSHQRLPPASLTKIATAVVALRMLPDTSRVLDTNANPDEEWLEDATAMGLQPGDRFSVKELLYGMMLNSGNDAAKELARAAAGTEAAFVSQMNALARELRLSNTHFSDVHGLGGSEHYMSAFDVAMLSRYAMTLPEFREVVGTESRTAVGSREIELYNHNPLLNYTPGVNGVKTGFTEEAGNTFSVSVERDGHGIMLVMLNAPNRAFDAIDLIEWAFANFQWK